MNHMKIKILSTVRTRQMARSNNLSYSWAAITEKQEFVTVKTFQRSVNYIIYIYISIRNIYHLPVYLWV